MNDKGEPLLGEGAAFEMSGACSRIALQDVICCVFDHGRLHRLRGYVEALQWVAVLVSEVGVTSRHATALSIDQHFATDI